MQNRWLQWNQINGIFCVSGIWQEEDHKIEEVFSRILFWSLNHRSTYEILDVVHLKVIVEMNQVLTKEF